MFEQAGSSLNLFTDRLVDKNILGWEVPAPIFQSLNAGFIFMFALSFSLFAIALSLLGLDYLTAMSGALTALANVGPGLGDIGPTDNFAELPNSAKWLLSAAMLLGRLELLTVLVLFAPSFWRG